MCSVSGLLGCCVFGRIKFVKVVFEVCICEELNSKAA